MVASGPGGETAWGASWLTVVKPCGILNHMVVDQSPRLDLVFHALAHPACRAIVRQLSLLERGGERSLSDLASPLLVTFPAATNHVRVLEPAKLVRRRVDGTRHLCRRHAAPLTEATLYIESFRRVWEGNYNRLDALRTALKQAEKRERKK